MSLTFEAIYLEGEGITKKSNPWKTTSFGRSFMGNQHCNGQCNHLGGPASFIRKRLQKYDIRDIRKYWIYRVRDQLEYYVRWRRSIVCKTFIWWFLIPFLSSFRAPYHRQTYFGAKLKKVYMHHVTLNCTCFFPQKFQSLFSRFQTETYCIYVNNMRTWTNQMFFEYIHTTATLNLLILSVC